MAANGPVSVRYQGVVMKSFYGHVLIGVLGLMYFCSSGVILPAANVVNPLMLQDASLGLNGTLLGTGLLPVRTLPRYFPRPSLAPSLRAWARASP